MSAGSNKNSRAVSHSTLLFTVRLMAVLWRRQGAWKTESEVALGCMD